MRTSAHSIKSTNKRSLLRDLPKEGTTLRLAYDRAMSGDWFDLRDLGGARKIAGIFIQLKDRYELEFTSRNCSEGTVRSYYKQYKCIGLWDGVSFKSLEDVKVALDYTTKGVA